MKDTKSTPSLTRREIQQRKQAMLADLRAAYQNSSLVAGDMAVSRRELSLRYGLSTRTIAIELEELVKEGILYTVPRVGTFIGRPKQSTLESYLILLPYYPNKADYSWPILMGFEERVAQLGGASLALVEADALDHLNKGELPALSGVFQLNESMALSTWNNDATPYVRFNDINHEVLPYDMVHFDDVEGGRQAAQHLLQMGHRHIAYLGLRPPDSDSPEFLWSTRREQGWREVILAAGLEAPSFYPAAIPTTIVEGIQITLGLEAAHLLIKRPEITAVTTANVTTATALFMALREAGIPSSRWPAVLCFDDATEVEGTSVSSIRLPWELVGRAAADVLWERKHGRLTGPAAKRLVPMSLIPRLTCRQDWGRSAGLAERQAGFADLPI